MLVGHSLGAVYAQTFARLYPDEVAGLLLVDPSVEQLDRFMMGEDEETTMPPMTLVFSPGAKAEFRGRRLAITDRDAAPPMSADIPITVLSAGRNMTGGYSELQEQVTALQSLMAADSDDGRHLIVENSGHNIQKEARTRSSWKSPGWSRLAAPRSGRCRGQKNRVMKPRAPKRLNKQTRPRNQTQAGPAPPTAEAVDHPCFIAGLAR